MLVAAYERFARGLRDGDGWGMELTFELLEHAVHGAGAPPAGHRNLEIVLVLSHLCCFVPRNRFWSGCLDG